MPIFYFGRLYILSRNNIFSIPFLYSGCYMFVFISPRVNTHNTQQDKKYVE